MFNPVLASENIKNEFIGYVSTFFHISDREYAIKFKEALCKNGVITKGPYLDINHSYKTGKSLEQLIQDKEASPLFRSLEGNIPDKDKELQVNRGLYIHQEKALLKTNQGKSLIVTTGTGSGKTECFMIPIIQHLLTEKSNGTLSPGVRAILIYPMNALANDQMKRLRELFRRCPDITFGVYNSSTKYDEESGIEAYGKIFKDQNGNPKSPLPNEVISRNRMQDQPPHILITNYAMLEYMMLRPEDDAVFTGAKLRFLVLDEAHIYRGTTGMETALLLKRLKARISNPKEVIHILTSATLGGEEANEDIVQFARTLCDAEFRQEDIIRSVPLIPSFDNEAVDVKLELFAALANPEKPLNDILEDFGMSIPTGIKDEEFLYDLCISSSIYRAIRCITEKPMTIQEITNALDKKYGIQSQDVVNVIHVASKAVKNNSALIKARYHMFVKALEGAFITIGRQKHIILNRNTSIKLNGEEWKVFECAVCDDCGRIAIVGHTRNGKIEFADDRENEEFYLLSDDEFSEDIEEDKYKHFLCAKCGSIIHMNDEPICQCGSEHSVLVRKVKIEEKDKEREGVKCPICPRGMFKRFYLGHSAATAVLGTSLFEELPESEKVLKSIQSSEDEEDSLFGFDQSTPQVEISKSKRQFLAFSDSRSDAAFFASNMEDSYNEFLRRRGICHVLEKYKDEMSRKPWGIATFVKELTNYFDAHKTFEPLKKEERDESLTPISRTNAWIAVLNEMVNARRSTSLASMGILKFNYKGNSVESMQKIAEIYHRDAKDIKALFDLLIMDILYFGALDFDGNNKLSDNPDLTEENREYIFYTRKPKRIVEVKDSEKDAGKSYLAGWCATSRNGKLRLNNRLNRMIKALFSEEFKDGKIISDETKIKANKILYDYWKNMLRRNLKGCNGEYYLEPSSFTISPGTEEIPFYVCDVCGRTTMINCMNMCATASCSGHLHAITHEDYLKDNHYARLYRSGHMDPFHILEHSAQLSRSEQQDYQEYFVNKEINALSCSTTFEMGVDVGDLETVYLRDMPPTPANYVQRAGRAGRGLRAAAFSLTYAKLGSHDFTYYKNPENMITGKISVPVFSVSNEKVVYRHIFAVALSDFFAQNEDVYNSNKADVLLDGDGWSRLCTYLESKPRTLQSMLLASIPENMHETTGIDDFSWTDKLIGKDGVLSIAVDDYKSILTYYEAELAQLEKEYSNEENSSTKAAIRNKINVVYKKLEAHRSNQLIEFLVRNNVLPKYGFPVDTVELHQNTLEETTSNSGSRNQSDKKLNLIRDLQIAISEYAPNAKVVADGRLYTSRYIKKLPQTTGRAWEHAFIAKCPNNECNTWNHRRVEPSENGEECVSCRTNIPHKRWNRAIEPRRGFIAEVKTKKVPMRKPEKIYHSDDYYIGDKQRKIMQKYTFSTIDGSQLLQMETSTNDSLMVVCNDDFYVCPVCGYAESVKENGGKKRFNSAKKKLERPHFTPWGKHCARNDLDIYKLCHVFKTDVVRLRFETDLAKDWGVMLSVMYALLEAMSSALDIERDDIKGCLHKVAMGKNMIYSIVLYDAVAGGAGHVRRLVTSTGEQFRHVVHRALEITQGCDCSPSCYSCLRNYYNQKVHEQLDRAKAANFLEKWDDDLIVVEDIPIRQDIITNEKFKMIEKGYTLSDSTAQEMWERLREDATSDDMIFIDEIFSYGLENLPKPSHWGSEFRSENTDENYKVDLFWEKQKVMLFLTEGKRDWIAMQKSGYDTFCFGEGFSFEEFVRRLKY